MDKDYSRQRAYHDRKENQGLVYLHIWVPGTHVEKFKAQAKRATKKHLKGKGLL